MALKYLAPIQALSRPKNQFSFFFVAFFVAKLMHLGSHAGSLPIVLYLLYTPTFFLPDVFLLLSSKLLIYRINGGQPSALRRIIGGALAVFTASCSAAQISFYIETGSEVQWVAASKVVRGTGGFGLLMSGFPAMIIAFMILYAIALVITPLFYDFIDQVLATISWAFVFSFRFIFLLITQRKKRFEEEVEEEEVLIALEEERLLSSDNVEHTNLKPFRPKRRSSTVYALTITVITIGLTILVTVLQTVRPTTPPYAHMSGSLPVTIIEAFLFQPINSEFCLPHPVEAVLFPFERFTKFFDMPQNLEWMPQSSNCSKQNGPRPPPWLTRPHKDGPGGPGRHGPGGGPDGPGHHPPLSPGAPPHPNENGFAHPDIPFRHGQGWFGATNCDIMKVSNLDAGILEPLEKSMKTKKPKIKNVLLLTLESTRKDMFPLKKDSHPYKTILSTYGTSTVSADVTAQLDAKLQGITDTFAFLSDEPTGFGTHNKKRPENDWRAAFKDGMGAININGASTQAAYTCKSLLSSHCGTEPLPVDFMEETSGHIYQHCLPQIFKKMSSTMLKQEDSARKKEEKGFQSMPWNSTFVQAVTDHFDSQDVLNEQMGFENVVTETTISDPKSKHYPPKQPWVNYFGFPETETFEYLRDLFVDAQKTDKRIFVSHLTSSTHHPFKTPKDWEGRATYMQPERWRPEDPLEPYLNTIHYQDQWVSQIFQMLHDVRALEETLVVMTGDHGLPFNALDNTQSGINNGHISNFAVPLLFIHPDLPRIQLNASATQISVIPTVLDLLLKTDSLPSSSAKIAQEILPNYQGNSMIRKQDYSIKTASGSSAPSFFQPFHFAAINPGGAILAIRDASTTFRLVLPLCSTVPLRFTDTAIDPLEHAPIEAWTMTELSAVLKVKFGDRAVQWVQLAEEMGRWWVWYQRERWGYWGEARETSRGGADVGGARGRIRKDHWWET
ncbi:alkaline-phosphatase-like protein [Phaeosphaeriaceae sp. PMI808]|nr:alkaline-phosphatase-like protein [Phaeosphaeriaceae sp. PMI808]